MIEDSPGKFSVGGIHQHRLHRRAWVRCPDCFCSVEATATRLAKKRYVQGYDGPVRTMDLVKIDGKWYAPSDAIDVVAPTREDVAAQAAIDAKRAAM